MKKHCSVSARHDRARQHDGAPLRVPSDLGPRLKKAVHFGIEYATRQCDPAPSRKFWRRLTQGLAGLVFLWRDAPGIRHAVEGAYLFGIERAISMTDGLAEEAYLAAAKLGTMNQRALTEAFLGLAILSDWSLLYKAAEGMRVHPVAWHRVLTGAQAVAEAVICLNQKGFKVYFPRSSEDAFGDIDLIAMDGTDGTTGMCLQVKARKTEGFISFECATAKTAPDTILGTAWFNWRHDTAFDPVVLRVGLKGVRLSQEATLVQHLGDMLQALAKRCA